MANETPPRASEKILLLLEDNEKQRKIIAKAGKRYFGDDPNCDIIVAKSANQAIEDIEAGMSKSPDAYLLAVMDYNMGANKPGERKPAEAIFFNDTFLRYLDNGAIIVIFSGYPEQVRQSRVIELAEKKENAVILVAVKSEDSLDDLFRILTVKRASFGKLKKIAGEYQHDMGNVLEYLKQLR